MPRVVIVGAGISGLSLAYRLQQAVPAAEINLLEKDGRAGGTVRTEAGDGFRVEAGPNGFLDTKTSTVTLCRDLGLGDRLVAASEAAARNRYLLLGGRLRRLPDGPGALLRSDVLSWRGKWGLLTEPFRAPRREEGDESIDAFARRRAGDEVAEVLADALVTGIHAGDPALLSLPATFPRVAELERAHGSVIKGFLRAARQRRAEAKARGEAYRRPGAMWSFPEGLQTLTDALRDRLARPPVLGAAVRSVEKGDGPEGRPGWVVRGEGRDRWPADAVVLTCPAYEQAGLLSGLDTELAERVGSVAYNGVAVVALGYRGADVPASLDGFGFLAPQRAKGDLLGVQYCSSIYPGRAPQGAVLLRAMCGGWGRPEMLGWDDARLLGAVRAGLREALGLTAEPVFHRIIRWERAIPQYHLGHLDRVAWVEDRCRRHPGLFLGGNAYRGVALNDCTERAEVLAPALARYLAG